MNPKLILAGWISFFIGFLISKIGYEIIDAIFNGTGAPTGIEGIIWVILIIFVIILQIALPMFLIYKGIKEDLQIPIFAEKILVIILTLFGLIGTFKLWDKIILIPEILESTFLIVLFYLGLILCWGLTIFLLPFHTFSKGDTL